MNHRRKLSHGKRFPLSLAVVALANASLWAPGLVWAQGKNGKGVAAARPTTLSAAAGLAMGLIGKGKVTLQSAWEQKLLGRDDLLQLLSRQQLNGVPQERQSEVRLGLASLLAGTLAQGEEGLKEAAQWPSPVRLSIADYYRSVRDERAVGLYQELIQELDAQVEKSGPVSDKWINPLAHLALFYAEMGQPLQAIQLWEQAEKYSRNPEWLADVALVMARAYTQAGDADKAKAAYAQVPQYGQAWYSGLAMYDQAYPLIKEGKHREARALLQQPLSGARANEAKVGLLSLLAASYLRTGEVEAARLTAQQALDAYDALKNAPQDAGMKFQVQRAKEVIQWTEAPLVVSPSQIFFVSSPDNPPEFGTRHLFVRSFRPTFLTIISSNPQVKAWVNKTPYWPVKDFVGYFYQQEVIVQVADGITSPNPLAVLTIRIPEFPDWEVKVPLVVEQRQGTQPSKIN